MAQARLCKGIHWSAAHDTWQQQTWPKYRSSRRNARVFQLRVLKSIYTYKQLQWQTLNITSSTCSFNPQSRMSITWANSIEFDRDRDLNVCLMAVLQSVYHSICQSVHQSPVCLFVCTSVYQSATLSVSQSVNLPLCLSICLSVYQSVRLSVYRPSISPLFSLSIYQSVSQTVCLNNSLSVYQSVNLSVYLTVYQSIF